MPIFAIALSVLSGLLIGAAIFGVLQPIKLVTFVEGLMGGPGIWVAVIFRLLMAVLLWVCAPISHTPVIFLALAFAMAISAAVVLGLGKERLGQLIGTVAQWPEIVQRALCLLGVVFGGFIMWSVAG